VLPAQPGNISLAEAARRTMGRIKVAAEPGARFNYTEIGYHVRRASVTFSTRLR
jgi:hypothetical protein